MTQVGDAAGVRETDAGRSRLVGEDIRVYFDGIKAVDGVDLELTTGEIVGLIGPNGAGKTTLMNALTGLQPMRSGRVTIGGREVTRLAPRRLARLGVARSFQGGRLFQQLTVLENVEVAALGIGVPPREARRLAWELLQRIDLVERAPVQAASLAYGEQRRLGIVRALALRPSFLLLDEPAAGLNEAETDDLLRVISEVPRDFGCAVLVIEHDMRLIFALCERLHVLDHGVTLAEGSAQEIRRDPKVIAAYLGTRGVEDDA
jgi:branched-chain amino acid transport system ATP-binding protein